MYFNEKHKQRVIDRGDNYEYIGSYKTNEVTIDGKNKKGNSTYIRVKCPYCGMEYDVILPSFDGKKKVKCKYCCNTYKNSFAYYIQQELKEPLNKYWDWEKNKVNPYLITKGKSRSNEKIWIKCTKTDYHGSYEITPEKFKEGKRCGYCGNRKVHPRDSFGQYLIDNYGEDAIEKYWSPKNTFNPFTIAPKSNNKKIWILCQEKDYHNDFGGYEILPANFYKGIRCGYCGTYKVHPKDSFGALYPEKAKYWSGNNKKSPFEVTPKSPKKYKFICQECGEEFERSLLSLNRSNSGVYCINCNNSELEETTKQVLQKYNVKYIPQKECDGLIGLGNGNLSYDFYLPQYNTLIECQGIQHERWMEGWITKADFERQLEHDRRKREYAKQHNIKLLEIWYYEIDKMEDILIKELNLKKLYQYNMLKDWKGDK